MGWWLRSAQQLRLRRTEPGKQRTNPGDVSRLSAVAGGSDGEVLCRDVRIAERLQACPELQRLAGRAPGASDGGAIFKEECL